MKSITLIPSEGQIQDFKNKYKDYLSPSKNAYIRYFFKLDKVTVSIYTSGKVLCQGEEAEKIAQFFGRQMGKQEVEETSQQDMPLIGSDEVGNGSYFGGLAVVASFVRPEQQDFLRRLGVGDSKTLTDVKIKQIAPILKANIQHQALLLSPKKYNEVIASGHNAVSIKVALHNQAIYLLLQSGLRPQKIVIDAFTSHQNYEKYVQKESNRFTNPITLEEKAEGKYLAVAVSSIIARDLFLNNLAKLGEKLGYTLPSGAGPQTDKVASQILQVYGIEGLDFSAKRHFRNTEKAKKLLER